MDHILIVEDVPTTRKRLEDLCAKAFPNADCVGAPCIADAQDKAAAQAFDLALLDLDLPDGSGLTLIDVVRKTAPHAVCVIATVSGDNANIIAALAAGADGYLLKEQHDDLMIAQLTQISNGIPALSPAIAQRVIAHFRNTGPMMAEHNLTPRELEVLSLIGRGLRNAEVADTLGISVTTVAGYIKAVYRKLGISSRAEAAWHARQLGL